MKPSPNHQRPDFQPLELTLESRIESADLAESKVVEFSHNAGYDEHQCHQIGLAVREAVANAILHGNRCDLGKKVGLWAEFQGQQLAISIRDEGDGFQPDALPSPLVSDNLLQDSGRGIFLVRACMDEVSIRPAGSRGTELIMIKYHSTKPQKEH